MKIYKPGPEEFLHRVEEAFALSPDEKLRVEKFAFDDESSMLKHWSKIAISTKNLLEIDYRDGQISFQEMMEVMRKLSLGLPVLHRLHFLGVTAEYGLKTNQEAKKRKRGEKQFQPNPPWFKKTVVDLFDMVRSCHPHLNNFSEEGESVYTKTSELLDLLQIPAPAFGTIEEWQRDPQYRNIQEYRYTKVRPHPDGNDEVE